MKICTEETVQYYENWEYDVEALPEEFGNWNPEDKFSWLSENCLDARKIESFPANIGSIEEFEIVES